ncbi:7-cyano-7-deazaguanine synthase, partial [Acinetobacter baumannii]|nr:7-cyano-7-deazaguanine synthase [Acinetobacter baumannii]EKV2163080.1 7-cyano-7-deazaguanine synthase [Acinetobacter baumannii]EKV5885643.1 7-cyano-7-deazaguanine synthase [Acinetobacter baumannii]EKV7987595.1 7-cyano-7-deazaguanine synthase [Acinetobacter baumannii]EKZ2497650.1 7-cyano-7-deazaguanine synthase [Acinetobacter baumannii]
MIELYFDTDNTQLPPLSDSLIPVHLYGSPAQNGQYASIGRPLLNEIKRIKEDLDETALDFLTIAMAITAADTFVERNKQAEDGWCREFKLSIPLINPNLWLPQIELLKEIMHFLSGDLWHFQFRTGSFVWPDKIKRGRKIPLAGHDSACLFSGGLDSAIGIIDLTSKNINPVLISHAYARDKSKQDNLYNLLGLKNSKFQVIAYPRKAGDIPTDVQMRTRSFNFIAFGALISTAISQHHQAGKVTTLYVPENGLISINPPLTPRRIGSLSTRTTHPHYMNLLNELFKRVHLPVFLENPYQFMTKGEMMQNCSNKIILKQIAKDTVSCGKWKRTGIQCGKCVPCIIRRASFNSAAIPDQTVDYVYKHLDLV